MKLIQALASYPNTRIFRVDHSEDDDHAKWDVEPIESTVLDESDGFFIVKAEHQLGGANSC